MRWFLVGFTATSGRDENAGAYLISRMLRRDWAGALIGLLPFIVALYFFFQNVNRLLPPNL